MSDERARLEAQVAAAEAEVLRLRTANAQLAEDFRLDPSDAAREVLKRGAASLASARDALEAATTAFAVFEKTGTPYGLVASEGRVSGLVAVLIRPGATREDRERAIDEALGEDLADAAEELGVVLTTSPEHYTRELPGRDAQGRTILEVSCRIEGDRLIPAVSRAAKRAR